MFGYSIHFNMNILCSCLNEQTAIYCPRFSTLIQVKTETGTNCNIDHCRLYTGNTPFARKNYLCRICGNSSTSRMDGELVSSITSRSIPMPSPPVGGILYSNASRQYSCIYYDISFMDSHSIILPSTLF